MRNLHFLNRYRDTGPDVLRIWGWAGDHSCGLVHVPSPVDGAQIRVIAAAGEGWDHVSVSRKNRPPNWQEMEHIKRMFFEDGECVMQLHVPVEDHINYHPTCLHLWRPHTVEIPRPPAYMVAAVGEEDAR